MAIKPQDWVYTFPLPMSDMRTRRPLVAAGFCPELTGVDGRFTGSLRHMPGNRRIRFGNGGWFLPNEFAWARGFGPGFRPALNFFKYAEIQKGNTRYILRGFVYRVGSLLRFSYYDTESASWELYTISVDSTGTIDVDYGGKFLYVAEEGSFGTTTFIQGGVLVTYDFGMPELILYQPGLPLYGDTAFERDDIYDFGILAPAARAVYNTLKDAWFYSWSFDVAIRFGDTRRGAWTNFWTTSISGEAEMVAGVAGPEYDMYFRCALSLMLCADGVERTTDWPLMTAAWLAANQAFLEQCNVMEVYRTISHGGNYYRAIRLHASTNLADGEATLDGLLSTFLPAVGTQDSLEVNFGQFGHDELFGFDGGYSPGFWVAGPVPDTRLASQTGFGVNNRRITDSANDQRVVFRPMADVANAHGATPKGSCISYFGGAIVKTPDAQTDDATLGEAWWSNLSSFQPETFPGMNAYRPPRVSDSIQALVQAGDYVFGLSHSTVHRFGRVGTSMAVQRLHNAWGVLSRYAVAVIGNSIFVATPASLVIIDANTGSLSTIGAMERILQDPTEWGNTKESIFLVHDSRLGALYLVNTAKEEAVVIWGTTNTITRLDDMWFAFGSEGPHPVEGGADRAFLCTPDGAVVYPDAEWEDTAFTQMGISEADVMLNGAVTLDVLATTTFNLMSVDWILGKTAWSSGWSDGFGRVLSTPDKLSGCRLYVLSADGTIQSGRIVTHEDGTAMTLDTEVTLTKGDWVTISPIPFNVITWRLAAGEQDPRTPRDPYRRRIARTLGVDFHYIAGDYPMPAFGPDFDGAFARDSRYVEPLYGVYRGVEEAPAALTPRPIWADDPSRNFAKVHVAGGVLCPSLRLLASNIDFELLSMVATGTLEDTKKV